MRLIGKPLELTLNLVKQMKDDAEASVSIEVAMSLVDTIEALQQENEQLRKERDQAIRDIDKGNCRSCVYDGKKICYGNMHGKDREVAKEQGLPYCIGWQWRGLEGRE